MVDSQSSSSHATMKEEIPFTCVSWGMYVKLANKLDPDGSVGNNWRMLAEKLGYNMQDIMVFESQQTPHGRNTIKVLQEYCQQSNSTVNALYRALEEIDRPDALEELKHGLPEIEKNYRERLHKKHHRQDLTENEYTFASVDDMAYSNDGYQAYPQGAHKPMMPPPQATSKYNMLTSSQPASMAAPGLKFCQRQKSADMVSHSHADRMANYGAMFGHSSPEFKRQRSLPLSESMVVRGHDNRSQYFQEHEPMDHAPSIVEDAVPLPVGMMRAMGRYNGQSSFGGMPSVIQNKPEPTYQSGFTRPKQAEMGLKLDIPAQTDVFNRQKHGDFCSPGPTPTTPSTPLGRLEKLANDRRYQPDEAYNDLMRMKQDEELLQSKVGNGGVPYDSNGSPQRQGPVGGAAAYNRHSDEMLYPRPKAPDPPNTFPLRTKSNSCSSSSSSSALSSTAQLTKSHSLPSNMKSAEYRKAFRHIKVFVTYAADDKRHTQRVLNLCQCLDKNGFTCCVDIFHRKLSVDERSTWCQSRFEEADFILCIISPKYRQEVDTCEMDNDADDSDSVDSDDGSSDKDDRPHRLHTKHIYRLMYQEHSPTGGQRCSRFVPVLFQGMSENLIPRWMVQAYNKLVYIWPKQYKDLLWMLTKPENRVPDHLMPPNGAAAVAAAAGARGMQGDTDNQELSECDIKLEVE